MTRAEQQQQRYLNTPCPRPGSRRKWKALGLSTDAVDQRMKTEMRRLEKAERRMRPEPNKDGNLAAFIGMLKSLGGKYTVLRFKGKKKAHSDGRLKRELVFVKEVTEDELNEGDIENLVGKYWRDRHGTLRRIRRA